jgi:hypothetical protein
MRELWRGVEQAVDWDKAITHVLDGEQDIPIVRPKFVPVAGGKAVFEWDARDNSRLVVTTILDGDMAA